MGSCAEDGGCPSDYIAIVISTISMILRRLSPIRSYIFLPLILFPWIAGAAFVHIRRPLNYCCHMALQWIFLVVFLHALYVIALVGFTGAIWHIEFRFDELRDPWHGIPVAASSIGILVLTLFSLSSSQSLLSQIGIRKREPLEFDTMGKALGIPDSGLLLQREATTAINPSEPLDKLLLEMRFRHAFLAFADSCLAGESVHFYDEVHELGKIPLEDPVRRIYMARHIIEKYIKAGATMEINISHRSRQEILATSNLADPPLFSNALNELIQLMKMFKEQSSMRSNDHDLEQMTGWNYSPRLSSVHGVDDPFHQEHFSRGSGCDSFD